MTKNENGFGTLFEGKIDVAEQGPEDKLKATNAVIKLSKNTENEIDSCRLNMVSRGTYGHC